MKFFIYFSLLFTGTLFAAEDVVGFWNTINEKTGKAESIIGIYEHEGKIYGRIIGSYGPDGKVDDTIEAPLAKAPGVEGHPYYSGLDIIWGLKKQDHKFVNGKILDPEKGKIYDAEMWVENGKLIVRGKIWVIGRNQTWIATTDNDFPSGFKKPDLSALVPSIPKVASTKTSASTKK